MFSKDQLIAFIDELNKDPELNLLTGTDKFNKGDMVKELVSKSLFDPKNIRMLLKLPPPEDTVFPVVPAGATSKVSKYQPGPLKLRRTKKNLKIQ